MLVKAKQGVRGKTKRICAALGQDEFQTIPIRGKAHDLAAIAGKALICAIHIEQVLDGRWVCAAPPAAAGKVDRVERIIRRDEAEREHEKIILFGEDLLDLETGDSLPRQLTTVIDDAFFFFFLTP